MSYAKSSTRQQERTLQQHGRASIETNPLKMSYTNSSTRPQERTWQQHGRASIETNPLKMSYANSSTRPQERTWQQSGRHSTTPKDLLPSKIKPLPKCTGASSTSLPYSRSDKKETYSSRGGRGTPSGPKIIHICSFSEEGAVSGLIARFSSAKSNYEKVQARFLKLPLVRLDGFKFEKSTVKSNHGMVLCHSYNNGGLTVTDVYNALYDEYLQYCSSFFGKERVAVIVHDMTFPITAGEILMSRFRKEQPTASKLSQLIVFSGSLADDKNLEMSDEDWKSMQQYLEKI